MATIERVRRVYLGVCGGAVALFVGLQAGIGILRLSGWHV